MGISQKSSGRNSYFFTLELEFLTPKKNKDNIQSLKECIHVHNLKYLFLLGWIENLFRDGWKEKDRRGQREGGTVTSGYQLTEHFHLSTYIWVKNHG